ncbi:MAG: hypothetical protein Q7U71_07805, partial [bacterium]|nr:hypothetical protein [bacterium]
MDRIYADFIRLCSFSFLYRQLRKRTKKKKARRLKLSGPRLRQGFSGPALRFSLPTGLSELGL